MRAMPNTTDLEAQLEALTREFVGQLVAAIRNASFADVAALSARYTPNPGAGSLPDVPKEKEEPRPARREANRVRRYGRLGMARRKAGVSGRRRRGGPS